MEKIRKGDRMRQWRWMVVPMALVMMLTACRAQKQEVPSETDAVAIRLGDEAITVDGKAVSTDTDSAVYVAHDIVYYEEGKDFTYGEGTENDAHSAEEAAAHTVVHITKAGTYTISGKLSRGQIAVDLGDGAKKDSNAVVTLVLDNADITCEVAPAVIFYNVYECGDTDEANATKDVDTTAAGANVLLADGSVNTVRGSYVARIYDPETVELNENRTEVEEAEKLHKYDAAFYSKRSMNVGGSGVLNVYAENEGLDSELHLTINGGKINIFSGNDGINTNEDNVSVTTVNGGELTIRVTGETGEGDGIDSNGWLVINGGKVIAAACATSADAGIDSDKGIHINGGTVIATGSMLDRIEDGGQNHVVFNFAQKQTSGLSVVLKNESGSTVMEHTPENAYSVLVYSSPDLKEGTYTLHSGDTQVVGQSGGFGGGMPPEGFTPPERPEGGERPEGNKPPERPEGNEPPERPEGGERPTPPEGGFPPMDGGFVERPDRPNGEAPQEMSEQFMVSYTIGRNA